MSPRACLPALALVLLVAPALAADDRHEALLKGSRRVDRDGWIQVHLEGPPERLGFQHGYLLADEIADLLRVVKPFLEQTTKRDWKFYREAARTMLWKGVEPEYQREIDGIVAGLAAKGVEADRWDIVALNALEELPSYYVPWLDKKEGKPPTTAAPGNCSAFVATGRATKDGRIVMGHNAWTNYVVGSRWNILFDLQPEQGARILMDGLPGVIVSDDDFGVNAFGLMVTETTITQFEGWDPAGKPEFSRARKAMQYARSIDDFVRIMLDGNNGGYANDWLIGDNTSGEIARLELGLKHHRVDRTKDGYLYGANFPVDPKLIAEETKFDPANKASSPNTRATRWRQLMSEWVEKIDVEVGKRFELDTFDVIDGKDGPNDRTLFGAVENCPRGVPEWEWGPYYPGGTVQSKVIDGRMADRLEFWAAMGHPVGPPFGAEAWLKAHPDYGWMRGLLRDVGPHPWIRFSIDGN
jgi:hypothetical protein